MFKYIFQVVIGLAVAGLLAVAFHFSLREPPSAVAAAAVPVPEPLSAVVGRAMDTARPKISAGRRQVLTRMITHVAEQTFTERAHQEYWVALLAVESRYESNARSSAGAIGLGQLLPTYRDDFGKTCGLTGFDVADVQDDYVNLSLSACYFHALIKEQGGSVPLATVAYNSGSNGQSLKNLKAGANPALEPAAYAAKIWAGQVRNAKKKK